MFVNTADLNCGRVTGGPCRRRHSELVKTGSAIIHGTEFIHSAVDGHGKLPGQRLHEAELSVEEL